MVRVHVFNKQGQLVGPVESPRVELSDEEWQRRLSPVQYQIVRGKGTASLSGPLGIVKQASAEVKRGLADFAGILANISVGLAIFNFLPVPALDGGRLVFLGLELVSGRRVNQKAETVVHLIGFLLLLGLVLAVTVFGDLGLGRRLFTTSTGVRRLDGGALRQPHLRLCSKAPRLDLHLLTVDQVLRRRHRHRWGGGRGRRGG